MKRSALFILALIMGIGLTLGGCTTTPKVMTTKDLVNEAKKNIREVSVSDAKTMFDKGGYVFLDCREPKEFKMGHVPGAIIIPRGLMEFKIDKEIPDKNANIIVYCKVGGRGSLAAYTLSRMGYYNVVNINGGWMAWEKAGYPAE